jgi:hypothetical protein
MPLSDRLKGLLDWWQLRIRTNQKDNEVNDTISASVCGRDRIKQEGKEIK